MTMTQLRAFILEAVAQAIPAGCPAEIAPPVGEKRKAVSFEREEALYDDREPKVEPL